MDRTITTHETKLDNIAEFYMALSDATPYHQPHPYPEDGTVMEGAVAVQSCVHDLLMFYKETMRAEADQISGNKTRTDGSPLVQLPLWLTNYGSLPPVCASSGSYGCWIQTELPNSLGIIGLNQLLMEETPMVCKGLDKKVPCIYYQGSTNSFQCSVHLLPDTQSGVVVLTNSMSLDDAADWIGEMFLEALLDNPDKNDYVELARNGYQEPHPRELEAYVGKYWNKVEDYCIEVILDGPELKMSFQSDRRELYRLSHYHYDVFSWLLTYDENARRGRLPIPRPDLYLLTFQAAEDTKEIDRLVWMNDPSLSEGETFRKQLPPRNDRTDGGVEGPV